MLTNIALAWTTKELQRVIAERDRRGVRTDPEVLRHIGPVHWEGINFRGTYAFPIEKHLKRLLVTHVSTSSR